MIQHVVQRVMDMDVENLFAATYGERSADRRKICNGYQERLSGTAIRNGYGRPHSVGLDCPCGRPSASWPFP
jgi:hypothetical protein